MSNKSQDGLTPEAAEKVDTLKLSYKEGKIGRRSFMQGALALGVSVTAASAFTEKVLAATPNKGGRFTQALTGGATSDVLDPGEINDSYMIQVSSGQLRNNLTEIAPNGDLIGELAESWEASPDAKTWTFNLRKGVEFHNGKTLDANDVVASMNHHRGEDSTSAAKSIVEQADTIKADGKNTVVFDLKAGNADYPVLMSDYHIGICPANSDGTMDWQSGIGTGGYSLEKFDPGVSTVVKRNPNYWKEGRAHFDEVENLQIADLTARTSGLQNGSLDCIANADPKTLHLLKKAPNIKVLQTNGNKHATLPMLCNQAPFDNNHVRLALKYAIDREQWLNLIVRGYGEVGNDIPLGPANRYRATEDEIPQRKYDLDKAKYHLKQAGLSTLNVPIHMADTAFTGAVDAGQLYAESARPAGINIEVVREPDDGYWSNVWQKKPWSASYWGGRPTEDWIFSLIYASDASWTETFWSNKRFDELMVKARVELDDKKRRDQYVEMQQIVRDDGGAVIPIFMAYVQAASDKVMWPDQVANNWELDGHKNAERWWFA